MSHILGPGWFAKKSCTDEKNSDFGTLLGSPGIFKEIKENGGILERLLVRKKTLSR